MANEAADAEHSAGFQDIDAKFRDVLGRFCSGVTVISARANGLLVGMTCQSFFSVSLKPPLVAISPSKKSTSYPRIREAGAFCVNVLAEHQSGLCRAFAQSGAEKWSGVGWHESSTGQPRLDGALAWLDCKIHAEYDTGDHYLSIARVLALDGSDERPLLFYRGQFAELAKAGAGL